MSPRGPRKRIAKGVYEDRLGLEARVCVRGLSDRCYWPKRHGRPSLDEIRDWQDKARVKLRRQAKGSVSGPFVDDCRRYLAAVKSMPTYHERVQHLEEWCAAFGPRRRATLTPAEIRAQLEAWRAEHGWSASALNHRRTALQHLFSVLDGKSAENPVRDVPRYREPDAVPRGLPWALVRRILKAMPPGVDRLRLAVEAWTGLPHSTLGKLTRANVDWDHRTLARPGRRKGAGTRATLVRLTRRAAWYFRLLDRCGGWGPFDRWHLRREFQKACRVVEAEAATAGEALDLSGLRIYDATRHSFGTWAYEATHDLAATAALMDHSSLKMTQRYTLSAVPAAMASAVAKIDAKGREILTPARDAIQPPARKLLVFKGRP